MASNADFLRQIHPVYYYSEIVSEQAFSTTDPASINKDAFIPTTKDEGLLSTYDAKKFSPQASFEHYTANQLKSTGVLGISEIECSEVNLPYTYDTEPFEGHCSINFREKTKKERKACAIYLRDCAAARGWLYKDS